MRERKRERKRDSERERERERARESERERERERERSGPSRLASFSDSLYPACESKFGFRLRDSGSGFCVSSAGIQSPNFGIRVVRVSGTSASGFQVSGSGFQISGSGLTGFRESGIGFRASGLGCLVPGFRIRISDFGIRVSGFRVSGLLVRERQVFGSLLLFLEDLEELVLVLLARGLHLSPGFSFQVSFRL